MENIENEEEILHEIGKFEPMIAKRILENFEEENIPFEIEIDDSALSDPMRAIKLSIAMPAEGSKLIIFVPESSIGRAGEIVKTLFPE